jgi:undecaprenyl diphosphate synthase
MGSKSCKGKIEASSLYPSGTLRIHELTAEERAIYATLKPERLPEHVAIIMDGNGRWAGPSLAEALPRPPAGRQERAAGDRNSLAHRPALAHALRLFSGKQPAPPPRRSQLPHAPAQKLPGEQLQRMMDNNVRIRYIGRTHELPPEVQDKMAWAAEATARNTGTTLTLALNYGGRSEMVDAFAAWRRDEAKHLSPDRITEEDIHRHLYTAHMPDPDLLIRTSGEMRLSNYLLWQIAYTEIFVTERFWPDFPRHPSARGHRRLPAPRTPLRRPGRRLGRSVTRKPSESKSPPLRTDDGKKV